jgi:hypothetical protein
MDQGPSLIALTVVLLVLAGAFWVIERLAPAIRGRAAARATPASTSSTGSSRRSSPAA